MFKTYNIRYLDKTAIWSRLGALRLDFVAILVVINVRHDCEISLTLYIINMKHCELTWIHTKSFEFMTNTNYDEFLRMLYIKKTKPFSKIIIQRKHTLTCQIKGMPSPIEVKRYFVLHLKLHDKQEWLRPASRLL